MKISSIEDINVLNEIVVMGNHQQFLEPVNRRDKFGVGAVHQLDTTHLIEGNRVVCPEDAVHFEMQIYILFNASHHNALCILL